MNHFTLFTTRLLIAGCLLATLYSCSSRYMTTTWKADVIAPARYDQVMVVAIVPEEDSLLRKTIETDVVNGLAGLGYHAVSAQARFGPKGLSGLGEGNTYLKLCEAGIDAVMTVALIRKTNQTYRQKGEAYVHPNSFYYNRIWNYKNFSIDVPEEATQYFWESIFFDPGTLEAVITVRTEPFAKTRQEKINTELADGIIRKMLSEDILQRKKAALRPF
jgi:hypothetical protein